MFTITLNNEEKTYKDEIRVRDLFTDTDKKYPVATVNNRLRELSYKFNYDAEVDFLSLDHPEAVHIYEASIRYLIAMAFHNIYQNYRIKFKYSVSRSIFCYITNDDNPNIDQVIKDLDAELKRLVALDLPFERITQSAEQAKHFYNKHGYNDRVEILEYRPENTVHFYKCDGYQNYVYSYMVPSTGYLAKYALRPLDIGFVIQYPRAEADSAIPKFEVTPKYLETLQKASVWAHLVEADTIANLNRHMENNSIIEFVHMCEAKHNAMLTEIGDLIAGNDDIKLIAIAGPSSSGKTTFSNRLRIELMTRGLRPVTIALDDYYLNRDQIPVQPDGSVDLEHINTLDIKLFNENMKDLIDGKEATLPIFDFHTKNRGGYRKLKLQKNNPIIIEGIHALNDLLTSSIPKEQTFKIYISPQLQMNLDNHNPISITNLRLIRRIVRDKQFRNASALRTIGMWDSVRAGEFKWIYPNQEHADYVYNSGLQYELCVLKKYALPTLKEIANDSEHYVTANRLIKFMKYFIDIPDEVVPCNSLLREFIGGSCFSE